MKSLVVGINLFEYPDKTTGESVSALFLSTVVKNINYIGGKCVIEVKINSKYNSALYNNVMKEVNGEVAVLVDRFVNVEYDNNKQIVDFEILPEDDSSVVWGF